MELKKAFMELQSKMVDTKQKLKMADLQIENLKRRSAESINRAQSADINLFQIKELGKKKER